MGDRNGFSSPNSPRPTTRSGHSTRAVEKKPSSSAGKKINALDDVDVSDDQLAALTSNADGSGMADFFSAEVFQIILRNPTTAHQLLKFSQSRFCGENMEFLEKIDQYYSALDTMTRILTEINRNFTSPDAPKPLNMPSQMMNKINSDVKAITTTTVPALEGIFTDSQAYVEQLLFTDTFPRFVRHQVTMSATKALSKDRSKYQGLGDCFCLTDPSMADNPILFASDGFVSVTGYSRKDIIPRNCRFLQGNYTDKATVRRIRTAIDSRQESVELLLNYRKNGEPFWNLLYVVHSSSDILRVLSTSEEDEDLQPPQISTSAHNGTSTRRGIFRTLKSHMSTKKPQQSSTGVEQGLLNRIERMNLGTQMRLFYTAYSKARYSALCSLQVQFYSKGIIDLLYVNAPEPADFIGKDIFKVLSQHATPVSRNFKSKVKEQLAAGRPVSLDTTLLTPRSIADEDDEKFASHWTPVKDQEGGVFYVVLTLTSKMLC
ncbi:MAG: hypothetical protein M1825_003354 [Sarcosagium campestre]|nr:MAG: hypothetical protein M1825_003354 [Sarcosagium campestre]